MFPRLRKRIALAICPELGPKPWHPGCPNPLRLYGFGASGGATESAAEEHSEGGSVPVFRSVRSGHQPAAGPETTLSTPADRIVVFRRSRGMSQRGFAHALGVLPRVISYVETGERAPSRALLAAMAEKFDLSTDWVLRGTGPSPFPPRPRSAPPMPKC